MQDMTCVCNMHSCSLSTCWARCWKKGTICSPTCKQPGTNMQLAQDVLNVLEDL
jgi:hypothetical protein